MGVFVWIMVGAVRVYAGVEMGTALGSTGIVASWKYLFIVSTDRVNGDRDADMFGGSLGEGSVGGIATKSSGL